MQGTIRGQQHPPLVLNVPAFDIYMFSPTEQYALMSRFGDDFYALLKGRARILAFSEQFDVREATNRMLEETARSTKRWQREGRDAQRRFIERLVRDVKLKQSSYYIVVWPANDAERRALHAQAQAAFGVAQEFLRPVEELPPLFQGDMNALLGHLAPVDGQHGRLVAILTSWDMTGGIDFSFSPSILGHPFPVAMAIDVQTIPPDRVNARLEMASNRLLAQVQSVDTPDAKSEAALHSVRYAMDATRQGEGLHEVQIVVAVFANTQEELSERVERVKLAAYPRAVLRTAIGEQAEAVKFFTTVKNPKLRAERPRNVLSTGLGVMSPFGFRQRSEVRGILWGIDLSAGYPVFADLWERTSYSTVILGEPGYGKTFGSLLWLYREALRGTQIIMIDPQGNCERLAAVTGGSYAPLSVAQGMQLNLLDYVYSENLQAQVSHVRFALQALLKRPMTGLERGAVGRALALLYRGVPPYASPEQMPRLENLVQTLAEFEHARLLAQEIDEQFVSGPDRVIFNRPTNVDLRLDAPVVAFDVQHVEDEYKALVMNLLLGAISNKILKDPGKRRIVFIDEFGLLASDDAVGGFIASATAALFKRVRRFKASVWAVDQNLITFTNSFFGQQILETAEQVTIYHTAESALQLMGERFGQLTGGHLSFLGGAQQGEQVTIIGNREVYRMYTQASPAELDIFSGT